MQTETDYTKAEYAGESRNCSRCKYTSYSHTHTCTHKCTMHINIEHRLELLHLKTVHTTCVSYSFQRQEKIKPPTTCSDILWSQWTPSHSQHNSKIGTAPPSVSTNDVKSCSTQIIDRILISIIEVNHILLFKWQSNWVSIPNEMDSTTIESLLKHGIFL